METGSYLLLGTDKAMEETFGSTAHGSGRTMSRTAAKKQVSGTELQRRMERQGIYVKAATMDGLAEEAGMAYKDISEVVETMHRAGISLKVAALADRQHKGLTARRPPSDDRSRDVSRSSFFPAPLASLDDTARSAAAPGRRTCWASFARSSREVMSILMPNGRESSTGWEAAGSRR